MDALYIKDETGNPVWYVKNPNPSDSRFQQIPDVRFFVTTESLEPDGTVNGNQTETQIIQDNSFPERAQLIVEPGVLPGGTTVAIDVLQSDINVESPAGFNLSSYFVNFHLNPEPQFGDQFPYPGLTVILPLKIWHDPGEGTMLLSLV